MSKIFISKYSRLKVTIMPTVKQLVYSGSGSQETITYQGIVVEFNDARFDTKDWQKYTRPMSPDQHNPIRSEEDMVRLLKGNAYYGSLFSERVEETTADRKARIMADLAKVEAEEVANGEKPAEENAPEPVEAEADTLPAERPSPRPAAKKAAAKKTASKSSKIDL